MYSRERSSARIWCVERSVSAKFQIGLSDRSHEGNQALLATGSFCSGPLCKQFLFETFSAKSLSAPPGPRVPHDLAFLVVDGNGTGIRFDDEHTADMPAWNTIAVSVKPQPDVFMNAGQAVSR
jgi:hypothetical protein